jgi:hypothetical protein
VASYLISAKAIHMTQVEGTGVQEERRQPQQIKIVREIPLWGIITLVITVVVFSATTFLNQYYGQQKLFDIVSFQTIKIAEVSEQIRSLTSDLATKNLKDLEHDLLLADIRRRLTDLEAQRNTNSNAISNLQSSKRNN